MNEYKNNGGFNRNNNENGNVNAPAPKPEQTCTCCEKKTLGQRAAQVGNNILTGVKEHPAKAAGIGLGVAAVTAYVIEGIKQKKAGNKFLHIPGKSLYLKVKAKFGKKAEAPAAPAPADEQK